MDLTSRHLADLQTLLPPGRAWPTDPDAELTQLLAVLATYLGETEAYLEKVLAEADPRYTTELLADWEASLGLPDDISPPNPTDAERAALVVTKLTDLGGARIGRFLLLAQRLGYENVRTQRLKPFSTRSRCRDAVWNAESRFAWILTASGTAPVLDIERLTALIQREAPALSIPICQEG